MQFMMDATKGLEVPGETLEAEVKAFFDSAPPLQNSDGITQQLDQFIQRNSSPSGELSVTTFGVVFLLLCASCK